MRSQEATFPPNKRPSRSQAVRAKFHQPVKEPNNLKLESILVLVVR